MGERIEQLARGWIGTPYVHQASIKGAGTDCLGLIRGIWRELHGDEPEPVPPYSADWGEAGREEKLLDGAMRHLQPVALKDAEAPGQVLLFRMREGAIAKHLGILTAVGGAARFVHAYDRHGVIESPFGDPWRARLVRRFRFP
ncbi:NlpC/P60 family protein [uncultured Paracoccus sp.]|uniref:NlpC/P60 family protein n=1 Tax=uncultured Paracoccus sp. TaxID=189685 RepID=UPI00263597E1|nr:NlpC/P60 family protein [uncultured Paracoccus sp.]